MSIIFHNKDLIVIVDTSRGQDCITGVNKEKNLANLSWKISNNF